MDRTPSRIAQAWFQSRNVILLSLAILVPCFWQSRIQSIDLSSHIYNAWLASLISQNQAPGLWIVHQWNNVLFDWMLAALLPVVGANMAQRIAVGVAVLVFSWGAIRLITAGRLGNWWFLAPSVGLLAYGFIYHAGFFNFYLGLGICFWYLAFFLTGSESIRLLVTPLLILAWFAHPMPVVWAVGLAIYVLIAERLPAQARVILMSSGAVILLAIHFLLELRYHCVWSIGQVWQITGANQLLLFDSKYEIPFTLLLSAWVMMCWRFIKMRGWRAVISDLRSQLWLLTAASVALMPSAVTLPQYALPFSFISLRLSLAAGILLCCLLWEVRPNALEKTLLGLSVLCFCVLVFRDAGQLNRTEDQVDAAVAQLPSGSRVIGYLRPDPYPIQMLHTIDRACIGHCFSYTSYEPASRQFRVRVTAESPIVMSDYKDISAVERGQYRVQTRDLPVFLVYSCGSNGLEVCSRELHEGDVISNGH